ncbi:hypothetical protein R1flu_020629 [Riccia fluitans]|uniref:Uncharacterized protein n=1 Tax=Riccia fluitans TaxID=41844 RepID=A0ABD1ZM27_9MARC
MGLNGGAGGGLQLFSTSPHGGDDENQSGDFVDRIVDKAAEWTGTNSPLGTGASGNKGIPDIIMESLDSSMHPGWFHPSIATDSSIGWETTLEGTTEQPEVMLLTMGSPKESPIPPTVGDDNGFPMEVAWAKPFNVKEWQDDFKQYNDAKWATDQLNIRKFCDNQWLIDHWKPWKIQADGGTLKRSELMKSFLFYVGLEKEGIKIDLSIIKLSKNIREISPKEWFQIHMEC